MTARDAKTLSSTIDSLLTQPQSRQRDEALYENAVDLFAAIGERGEKTMLATMAAAFAAAGQSGHSAALVDYGRCLWNGWGVARDRDAALAAYQRAGELGSDYGAYLAAYNLYWHFKRDDEAYRWARKAQSLGTDPDGDIAYLLGLMAFNARGRGKDVNEAFRLHAQAADRGNANAQFEMSLFLMHGLAGEKNLDDAIGYLFQAGEQNHPRACLNLGAMYATGNKGLEMDHEAAYRWYLRAANAGNGTAAGRLALMSLLGQGTPIDKEAAQRWIKKADIEGFDVDALLEANGLERP